MDEAKLAKAWQGIVKPGDKVWHISDPGKVGEFVGQSPHPMFEVDVNWPDDPCSLVPCHLRNLRPEWWPLPEWALSQNR